VKAFDPSEIFNATYDGQLLTSANGSSSVAALLPPSATVNVVNTYSNCDDCEISSCENSFKQTSSVHGPLPVLGAGVAFGFSGIKRARVQA
jgi:hypothetical protein